MATVKEASKLSAAQEGVLAALSKEHGSVVHFMDREGNLFVCRPPTQDEYENTHERIRNKDPLGVVNRELCQQTMVHGDLDKLRMTFEKAPRLPYVIGDELAELAEGGIEIAVKKG